MSNLTTRAGKGSPLTNNELDANFTNLNSDKVEIGGDLSGTSSAPNVAKIQGRAVSSDAPAAGEKLVWNGTAWEPSADPSGEPIGHADKSQSSISFNNGNRTFSISPVSTSFDVWCKGVKYTYSTAQSVVIPNTTGLHFIYFSASGVLSTQMSYFTWEEHAPTAYVYWNATTQQAIYFGDERHGITLDWQTHEYLHRTRGAAIANGFAASGYTTTGLGATDADAQIDIGGGTFFDEDMQVDIVSTNTPVAGTWQQDLSGPALIPVLYLSGSAWVIDAPTNFPFKVVSGVPQYNLFSGGTWSTAPVTNNEYFVSWILATNNLTHPVIAIISQAPTNQLSAAEAMTFEGLNLNGFPSVEFRPLYKVIYQYKTGFTNSVKSSTIAVYDLRSLQSAGVAAALVQDHGNLSGLGDDDHAQYLHVSEVRSPSSAVKNSFLPTQAGQSGKYLTTDGSNPSWGAIPSGSLSFTGDVTGSGTTGSSTTLTLSNSGATAGTYSKVTVDAKGRVTTGALISNTDVTTALGFTPENSGNKGVANGYASLDGSGKVPSTQLPSYVDDVLEYANLAALPGTGESGKIYITIDTAKTYRWSGSAYVEISASPGSTDAVPEGSTNLYFTNSRARGAITATGSLSYNNSTGVLSYTQPTNVSTFNNDSAYITSSASITGNAATATKLATGRTIAVTGDVTGTSVGFDGSANLSFATTLANSGVTAGTYGSSSAVPVVTVDAKGRVTGVSTSAISGSITFTGDVTGSGTTGSSTALTLANSGVTAGTYQSVTVDAKGRVTAGTSPGYLTGNQNITLSGDASGSGATGISVTLANSGVTAGTYTKVTVDAKGRVTTGASLASGDLPTYTGTITSGQVTTALGYTPYNSSNPSGYITSSYNGFMLRGTAVQSNPNTNFVSSAYRFDPNANNPTNTYYAVLTYGNESNVVGQLATHFSDGTTYTRAYNSGWSSWRTQLDSINYSSYALPLSGGTMTGAITFPSGTPYQVLAPGSGTYNKHVQYISGTEYTLEAAMATDSISGTKLPITFTWRGGYASTGGLQITGSAAAGLGGNAILHAANYNSYSPTLTGTGASGTWGISISGSAAQLGGNSSSAYSGPASVVKQFFWSSLGASSTQARTFEIARLGIDFNDWNSVGPFEVELFENYYSNGLKKKYVISYGYSANQIQLVEYSGSGDNNFMVRIGSPVQVSGDQYYLPVFVDVRYYSGVSVRVTTNRSITASNPPGIGQTFINASPSATNISDFTADSTVNFASTTAVQVNGNSLLHAANYNSYALPLSGGTLTGNLTASGNGTGLYFTGGNNRIYFSGYRAMEGSTNGAQLQIGESYSATYLQSANNYATTSNHVILHAGNYSSYSPSLTGSGASGTWGISISGNAATSTVMRYVGYAGDVGNLASAGTGIISNYNTTGAWTGAPSGMSYGSVYHLGGSAGGSVLSLQIAADINHNSTSSTKQLWFRTSNNLGFQNDWKELLHSGNYSSYALPLSGGTLTGGLHLGSAIGSRGTALSVSCSSDSSAIVAKSSSYATVFSILPHSTSWTYLGTGIYYQNGSWVHASADSNNALLGLNGSSGASWYASNNSTASWNVATNAPLWNSAGTWVGALNAAAGAQVNSSVILTSANYSSYALPLSGGTLTGAIYVGTTSSGSAARALRVGPSGGSPASFGSYSGSWRSTIEIWDNAATRMLHLTPPDGTNYNYSSIKSTDAGLRIDVGGSGGTNAIDISTSGVANFPQGLQQGGNQVLHAGNWTSYTDGRHTRKDTTGQYLKPFYEYGSYLTSETPSNLASQMGGGGLRVDFLHPSYTGSGGWNHVITWSGYNVYNMYQLGGHYDGGTGTDLWVRSEANHGGTSWTAWRKLLNSSNYNSYAPTLTGGGASGTWGISISGTASYATNVSNGRFDNYSGSYNNVYTWLQFSANHGLYWPSSGAGTHFTPQGNTYGSWTTQGYRNTYSGLFYDTNAGTNAGWMTNGNASGFYAHGYGWKYLHESGVFYIYSGTYGGGSGYTALHSGNYTSYSPSLTGSGASGSWNITAARATRANGNFYIDDNYGNGIVGVYTSTRYQGVFAMGDSYKLPADGSSTGSLYGMAWSHPNAGGVAGNLDSHGMLVLINGGFGSCMSYSIKASGNVTAYSDERLKTNWRPMPENFVERLAQVRVGVYDRTDGEKITQVGIGAQSLQKLLPEAITKAGDEMGTLSVSYGNAAMASAVELAKEIVNLKREIEMLKSKLH